MIELLHIDCMEYMKGLPDRFFDLAIVDPPYGINMGNDFNDIKRWSGKDYSRELNKKDWDKSVPEKTYFDELKRVSVNQIIWGGNYFMEQLPSSSCFIVWHKSPTGTFTADCELAWTSFKTKTVYVQMFNTIFGNNKYFETRIHPTQKPVALYKYCLKNYAKQGDKILDTHLGSGSSAIAAERMGFDFVGCEIDEDYFKAAQKRFTEQTIQKQLF